MASDLLKMASYIQSVTFDRLPKELVEKAKICILDIVCDSAMGYFCEATEIAKRSFLDARNDRDQTTSTNRELASVWFEPVKADIPHAIFINSTSASVLDIDDGLDFGRGHAGSLMIPAVLTVCEANNIPTAKAISAIVVGYDVMFAATDHLFRNCTAYPQVGCIGVAGALSNLFQVDTKTVTQSLRVAESFMPHGTGFGAIERGAMTKESINFAAMTGYWSFMLAKNGYTGPTSALEQTEFHSDFVSQLGQRSALRDTYLKFHATCRWAHYSIEALLAIKRRRPLDPEEVERIVVNTYKAATTLSNPEPLSIEGVQYSIPFALALVMKYGEVNWPEIEMRFLDNPDVRELAKRVELREDSRFAGPEPAWGRGSELEIWLKNGDRLSETITELKGDKDHQLSFQETKDKFQHNCERIMSDGQMEHIAGVISDFEHREVTDLIRCLTINKLETPTWNCD